MKTVSDFIEAAKSELGLIYDETELKHIIFLLLEEVKGFSLTDLQLKKGEALTVTESDRLDQYLGQLKQHKPIQYVLGHAWFSGLKFLVNENVLIPRPETEELCYWLLSQVSSLKSHISVLDIGTGSGCIAITLKKKLPAAIVHAVDISKGALEVAKKNAEMNATGIVFHQGDILSEEFSPKEKFDIIVSNPPYITKGEMQAMAERVTGHEPHTALFVESHDALIFYRAIAAFSKMHLKPGGRLFFEINEMMGKEIKELLLQSGFQHVEVRKDISGKERMVMASDFTGST